MERLLIYLFRIKYKNKKQKLILQMYYGGNEYWKYNKNVSIFRIQCWWDYNYYGVKFSNI